MRFTEEWVENHIDPALQKYAHEPPREGFAILYVRIHREDRRGYIGQFKRRSGQQKNAGCSVRWRAAPIKSNCHFQNALRKYGREGFVNFVLKEVPENQIDAEEDDAIVKYDTMKDGFNSIRGGAGVPKFTPESFDWKRTPEAIEASSKRMFEWNSVPKNQFKKGKAVHEAFKRPHVQERHSEACKERDAKYPELVANRAAESKKWSYDNLYLVRQSNEQVLPYEPKMINRTKGALYYRLDGQIGRWNGRDFRVSRFDL